MLTSAALAVGCGGGDEETTRAAAGTTGTGSEAQNGGVQRSAADRRDVAPLGPARAKESAQEAERRISEAVSSGDCQVVNELNPLGRPELSTQRRCDYLRRLDGLEATGAEEYGGTGAVIDYGSGPGTVSAVMVLDRDGRYHVAFLNPFTEGPTVGTTYAKGFDRTAEQALEALAKGDCDAFGEVVFRRIGLGAGGKRKVCEFADQNPVGNLLEAQPDAKLERAGGSAAYAFYTLGTPTVNFTIVLAREQEAGAPPSAPPLPKGAARYGYVSAYPTNQRAGEG